jgi:hypothetical protein
MTSEVMALCGATKKASGEPCGQHAGANTDHLGKGKCWLHGGRAGATPYGPLSARGRRRSLTPIVHITERMEEILESEDLLSVDREAALLRAALEDSLAALDNRRQGEFRAWEILAANAAEAGKAIPTLHMTGLSKDEQGIIDLLVKTTKTAYEMRFSKRFSIPITELASVLRQIAAAFDDVCEMYGIMPEARDAFVRRMGELKLPGTVNDAQLMRAGLGAGNDGAGNGSDAEA